MLTTPHRWQPGSRWTVAHFDRERGEHTVLRGMVLQICELTDAAYVATDGVPVPTWVPLEILTPECSEAA